MRVWISAAAAAAILPAPPPKFFSMESRRRSMKCKCIGSNDGKKKEEVVWEMVEELLQKDENEALLTRLQQASDRLQIARTNLRVLQSRAAEIAEFQKEISEAKAKLQEAERFLEDDGETQTTESSFPDTDASAERLESAKAGSISAIVGTLAQLPFSSAAHISHSQLIISLLVASVSSALFGVTFRYAVRRTDLDNVQLKLGTSAAFGFVKGLGALDGSNAALDAAVGLLESLSIFAFAGVALDFCMKFGIVSPFPINQKIKL